MKKLQPFVPSLLFMLLNTGVLFTQNTTKQKLSSAIKKVETQAISYNKEIDSLLKQISLAQTDTTKIKLYLHVCDLCEMSDNLKYSNPVFILTDKLLPVTKDTSLIKRLMKWRYEALKFQKYYYQRDNKVLPEEENAYKQHIKTALRYNDYESYSNTVVLLSDYYFKQGHMLKKINCLEEGYETTRKAKHYPGTSRMLIQIAFFYANNKDTASALDYIEKAVENEKFIHDSTRKNRGFIIRGNLYRDLGQYSKALTNYQGAIAGYRKIKDTSALADVYRQIGYLYQNKKEYEKAIENFETGEKIAQSNNDLGLLVQFMIGKGDAMASLGRYDAAIEEHRWLWEKISSKLNETDKTTIIFFGSHLAKDYVLAKQFQKAKNILNILLPLATVAVEKSNIENLAFRTDSALGNYKEAMLHYMNFMQVQQKLNDAEVAKAGVQQKFKTDMEKQKAELEKQAAVNEIEKKRQRVILYSVLGALFILAVLAAVIFRSLRRTRQANKIIAEQKLEVETQKTVVEEQKHLVEEKQKEILDSITYAKRLQQAILPPQPFIDSYLPENFVLYKPKDIVAGDFYWAEHISGLFFIAAADSTGHGVPGAMVSVVCSNALNRSVKEFGLIETGKILDKTRELVIETFAKSSSDVKDGMDISLLCIDTQNKTLTWSGANNPLWYIEENELKEIKADKQPIGRSDGPVPFTTHRISFKTTTTFYLFTDGLADQFGGPRGKKFKYKQFEELLVSINLKPMKEQSDIVNQQFENWKGTLEQVDDVCVIGIKL